LKRFLGILHKRESGRLVADGLSHDCAYDAPKLRLQDQEQSTLSMEELLKRGLRGKTTMAEMQIGV